MGLKQFLRQWDQPLFVPAAVSRWIFYPLWDLREGKRLQELNGLEKSQWAPMPDQKKWRRLQSVVSAAINDCAYYREKRYKLPRTFEDFKLLPLLTKEEIRKHTGALISRRYPMSKLIGAKTGGSTGVSLQLYFDEECQVKRNAAAFRSDRWAGWELGEAKGALWGNPPEISTWKELIRHHLYDRTFYLDTVRLDDASMREFAGKCMANNIRFLFGHAHSLFIFANYVKLKNIDLPMEGIVSTSMMLLSHERAVIESVFGCPVTDRYGCEEVGLIAGECEKHTGLHLNTDHLFIEFLNEEGEDVEPGQEGMIVVTDLANQGMPLLRYVVGDRGIPSHRRCSCGRELPLMERVTGRLADFLVKPDGSLVAGVSLIERTLTLIPGLCQMQLVQPSLNRIEVKIVPDQNYSVDSENKLRAALAEVFGPEIELMVQLCDHLDQQDNGKYRFSICLIPSPYQWALAG